VWVDREGNQEELPIPPDAWVSARISADGRRALLEKNADGIWSWDFERELLRRQGTARDFSSWPEWLGSTDRFMFQGFQDDLQGIFVQTVDVPTNVEPVLLDHHAIPAAGTLDENVVLLRDYGSEANPRGSGRLVACSLDGTMRELVPRPARYATLSPDQRWLAYQDNEGGADYRIFVRPYPGPGPSIQVSAEWAQGVAWSPDGSEIYYRTTHSEQEAMHAVPVRVDGGGLTLGRPRELFRGDFTRVAPNTSYDVASDGRFLMLRSLPNHPDVAQWERGASSIRIVDNWFTELQGKLGEPGS
jgi:hypothetical protein